MKAIRFTRTAAVVFLFGATMPVYAQHESGDKQEERTKPQEQHTQQPQRAQQPVPQQHAAQPREQEEPRQVEQQRSQPSQGRSPQTEARPQQAQQTKPAYQQEQRGRQAVQQQQRYPQTRQQQTQQDQQARQRPQQRTQQQARSWQQQKGWAQGGGSVGHATFAQDRSQNWSSDHRTWAQRGGYGGYFIPQATFSVTFGSQHYFRLVGMPSMYMGYPRFSQGGFSFLIVDPWPGDWAANWYSSDDVYVDYNDDGYYLYNRRYPSERLAITIVL